MDASVRRRGAWRAALVAWLMLAALSAGSGPAAADGPQALVYVFRPMGGKFMGRDMDNLAGRIEAMGYPVEVNNYTAFAAPAKEAIRLYREAAAKPRIIAFGYSAGGDSAIRFALVLKKAQVPVDLIITLDPTRIANRVPANVQRFINLFNSSHTLGGGDPKPARDFKGHFAAVDLKNFTNVIHLEMAGVAALQDAIAAKVAEVAVAPRPEGAAIPIAYTPPRDAPLVLWDSGVPVNAGAGETVAMVAAQFGVPPWLVADVNHIDADRTLTAGQRLIVPRHLAAAGPAD